MANKGQKKILLREKERANISRKYKWRKRESQREKVCRKREQKERKWSEGESRKWTDAHK